MGDNADDLSMIRAAGLGVAIANATDEVKAAADVVLESTCDEDPMTEVIERFVLA